MQKFTKQQAAEAQWRGKAEPGPFDFCPVRTTLNVLGGKWKLLILSYLLEGTRRYGELRRLMPEITEKMLIQELREMEQDGLVQRVVYQQVPPKVEYLLTEHGQQVQPLLNSLVAWGQGYLTRSAPCVPAAAES
ncbi:helix-turn-helix transcriptional regulator [Hymenobacter lutimineralis]|uniref:Helix-turn-helix transcriptional regulator n=1 Tax=Hymenobacter lutimineralis TaxID=2606448 RepID=A0A5D6V1W1_9BACT|nr:MULTISPECIES: helix-turn-helix domain-containing protein [Hymenobacter]QIX61742.1 helix-turn-helix transcriptional regulator [Hymenobacter sp. BT18]TYZ09287.1 helix-turn-helix transcriptional regulator [Hymenobacter lutimineralis]